MIYDQPTVDASALPLQKFDAPAVENVAAKQAIESGNTLTKAGGAVSAIANSLQDDIDTATTKENDNRVADAFRTILHDPEKGYLATPGKLALTSRDGVIKSLKEAVKEAEKGLQNDVQRYMFKKTATARMQSALLQIDSHAMQQAKIYNVAEAKARADGARMDAIANWAGWADPSGMYAKNKSLMMNEIESVATIAGIPKMENGKETAQYRQLRQGVLTQLHSDVLNNMISLGHTGEAKKYYTEASKNQEILPDKIDELNNRVKVATTATEADNLATRVFGELRPSDRNGALSIFQMHERVRELAGDNEDVQKAALQGIDERARAWNGEQTEFKAQNVAGVWQQVNEGKSMKQIQLSPSWAALTATEQRQIRNQMEQEAATRASRAAANSQRELADLQRREHLSFLKNGDKYLTVSDPNVLIKMSRAQIEALRGDFGMDRTLHLLRMQDALKDPKKFGEAKMDSDDFNNIAVELKLDPYNTKDKTMRSKVGALKFHIEQSIDLEQRNRTKPMTRQEKMDFVKKEMSKKVLIDTWGPFDTLKPALSLTAKDRESMIVPKADREQIVSGLRTLSQKYPNDPRYAPTEANVRRTYLQGITPGAAADFQETE